MDFIEGIQRRNAREAANSRLLADVLKQEAKEKGEPIPHVCGLSGFGLSLDDVCPACEDMWETWRKKDEASN